jgi:hypothetical protein
VILRRVPLPGVRARPVWCRARAHRRPAATPEGLRLVSARGAQVCLQVVLEGVVVVVRMRIRTVGRLVVGRMGRSLRMAAVTVGGAAVSPGGMIPVVVVVRPSRGTWGPRARMESTVRRR